MLDFSRTKFIVVNKYCDSVNEFNLWTILKIQIFPHRVIMYFNLKTSKFTKTFATKGKSK